MKNFRVAAVVLFFGFFTLSCVSPEEGLESGPFELTYELTSEAANLPSGTCATISLANKVVVTYPSDLEPGPLHEYFFDVQYSYEVTDAGTTVAAGDGKIFERDREISGSFPESHKNYWSGESIPAELKIEMDSAQPGSVFKFNFQASHYVAGSCWTHCSNHYKDYGPVSLTIEGLECAKKYTLTLKNKF